MSIEVEAKIVDGPTISIDKAIALLESLRGRPDTVFALTVDAGDGDVRVVAFPSPLAGIGILSYGVEIMVRAVSEGQLDAVLATAKAKAH